MNADKPPASAEAIKGSVKEAIGKLIGDGRVEAEGRREAGGGPRRTPPEADTAPGLKESGAGKPGA